MTKSKPNAGGVGQDLWKGIAAGVAGGLAASVVMNQFQRLIALLANKRVRSHGAQSNQPGSPGRGIALQLQKRGSDAQQDDATMRLSNAISAGVLGKDLTQSEKRWAGTLIHYGFGTVTGAAYGMLAEWTPGVTAGAGLPMGAFVWATADEGVVPALGLSKWSSGYSLSTHATALASHLVFGLTTELVRSSVRKAL
jgi:putative membrane protein